MKKVKYLLLSSLLFVSACSEKSEQVDPLLSLETCSVKGYGVSLEVRCDIFQFEEPAKDSPQEKINKIIFAEFADYENFILTRFREYTSTSDAPNYRGELRAISQVYINTPTFLSLKNRYYCYNHGAHGNIRESGMNFKILPNGEIKQLKLSDIFDSSKDYLTPLLKLSIKKLKAKYKEEAFWNNGKNIEEEILGNPEKEKYFNSFLISDKDTLILIFEALSIMPNVHGMPTIEIPIKELNYYKGY